MPQPNQVAGQRIRERLIFVAVANEKSAFNDPPPAFGESGHCGFSRVAA